MINKNLRTLVLGLGLACGLVQMSLAHGYIEKPGSRNYYCGVVTTPDQAVYGNPVYKQCTEIFKLPDGSMNNDGYNFMAIVTHTTGRQGVGGSGSHDEKSLPQNVCGFDSERFAPITPSNPLGRGKTIWDTPIDWPTSAMTAGSNEFIWNIAYGPHFSDTEEFNYWITKPDFKFQVGKPLTWNDFEPAPFCHLVWNGQNSTNLKADYVAQKFHMTCNVPARSGRQVIYGEWGRNSATYERFHSCMDVVFGGSGNVEPPVTVPVEAKIMLEPNVDRYYGSGDVTLNGGTSTGDNLTYQWSVSSEHPDLYTIQNANQVRASLHIANPAVQGDVVIKLSVKNANGQHSDVTQKIIHIPSAIGQWADLGQLTRQAKTLAAGDKVWVRTVLKNGQDVYYPTNGLLVTAATASANSWPYALATEINLQNGDLMVGVYNNGKIEPIKHETENRMFAKSNSTINSSYLVIQSGGNVPAGNGTGTAEYTEGNTNGSTTQTTTSSSGGGCSTVTNGNDFSLILVLLGSICYGFRRRYLKLQRSKK